MTDLRYGGHVAFNGSITKTALQEAIDTKMGCFQFFLGNRLSYNRSKLAEDDIVHTYDTCKKQNLCIYTHMPYVYNLCGTKDSTAWAGNKEIDTKMKDMIENIEYEVNTVAKLGPTCGCVIHPGTHTNRKDGLEAISASINKINFEENSCLLLENCAGEGTKIPKTFEEISQIIDGLYLPIEKHVGVCIDTAHIWGAGIYDLSKRDGVDTMFHDFDKYIGLDKFKLLHLNSSKAEFGSKKDQHDCLHTGKIWKNSAESLVYLITRCEENNIPIILETPDVYTDMKGIQKYAT